MKIFKITSQRCTNGGFLPQEIMCSLSYDEVKIILSAVSALKPVENAVVMSNRQDIVESIKEICHE